jgi:hypothetical protein
MHHLSANARSFVSARIFAAAFFPSGGHRAIINVGRLLRRAGSGVCEERDGGVVDGLRQHFNGVPLPGSLFIGRRSCFLFHSSRLAPNVPSRALILREFPPLNRTRIVDGPHSWTREPCRRAWANSGACYRPTALPGRPMSHFWIGLAMRHRR